MQSDYKIKTLRQLKRAEGMLKKVVKMAEEDRYCIDILQQSLAVAGLMKGLNKLILESHLHTCFKNGMKNPSLKKQKELIDEVIRVLNKA